MIVGEKLSNYVDKIVRIKTSRNLYLKLCNIHEKNSTPDCVLVNNKSEATEFILLKKSETNIIIRLNKDIHNQNGSFGYHLYVIPNNDILYGSGNDELWAQFNLEQQDSHVLIRSAYKNAYLCHQYDVMRCRPLDNINDFKFELEECNLAYGNSSVCIITYGFMKKQPNLNASPILNTLHRIYPNTTIDIYMHLPDIFDEFYNVSVDTIKLRAYKCNVFTHTYKYDMKQYMKMAYSMNMPIINNKKNYSYRTLNTLYNISEAVKHFLSYKRIYSNYILLRNDSFENSNLLMKELDRGKLFCINDGKLDNHMMLGKDILSFNSLYDFFLRNKTAYTNYSLNEILHEFLKSCNIILGNLCQVSPTLYYPKNREVQSDDFYRKIYILHNEMFGNYSQQKITL